MTEEIKSQLDYFKDEPIYLRKVIDELEQENERYKQLSQGCLADGNDCGFCEIDKRNKELEQENKELRDSKFRELDRALEAEDKYKSSLEEIRKLTVIGINASQCNCGLRALTDDILNKINEVLGC